MYMEDQIKQIMADVLDLEVEYIDRSTTQDNTPNWDSLNHVNLIIAVEQEFDLTFSPEQIEGMTSFSKVVETLETKLRLRTT
jgi:acyl carrier protein